MSDVATLKKILVVCTGNTCRSPMAEALFRQEAMKRGWENRVEVLSCGTGTRDGMPAATEAVFVMKNREVDISDHRSRQLTPELVKDATVIVAMNPSHVESLRADYPEAKKKIVTFNIPDPIGMSIRVYEDTVQSIQDEMKSKWSDIQKKDGAVMPEIKKVSLASDHRGIEIKNEIAEYLKGKGIEVVDFGTNSSDSCDYPDFMFPAAEALGSGDCQRAVGICYTGIGSVIAANKVVGVRAALVEDVDRAKLTRQHNDSNMLILASGFHSNSKLMQIVDAWFNTDFEGGRHEQRVNKIKSYESRSHV